MSSTETQRPNESINQMTIEELSDATGLAPRTIRFYQAEKLLQKPERDDDDHRVARYGAEHLERLRLIGELRDRGLKLPAIRGLLQEGDSTTRVADWLGLDDSLRGSWGHDAPSVISRDELSELLGDVPPGTRGYLEDGGYISREGDQWVLRSPALVEIFLAAIRGGIRPDLMVEAGTILQSQLGKAADELVELFVEAVKGGFGRGIAIETLTSAGKATVGDAARIIFGLEIQRAIEALLADTRRLGKRK